MSSHQTSENISFRTSSPKEHEKVIKLAHIISKKIMKNISDAKNTRFPLSRKYSSGRPEIFETAIFIEYTYFLVYFMKKI